MRRRGRGPLLVAGGAALLVGAALARQARRDARAIAADPERVELSSPPKGRPLAVKSADGTLLHAEVFGPDGAPTIVLVHGWTCSLQFWHYQLRDLPGDLRVVAYDQRGHGQSQRAASGDCSAGALAADLDAVLEEVLDEGERAVVVGHSMGGMAVVAWAGAHPENVRRRVAAAMLVNTGVAGLLHEARVLAPLGVLSALQRVLGPAVISSRLPMPRRPSPPVFHAARLGILGPDATPAQVAFAEQLIMAVPPDVRGAFGKTLAALDLRDAAPSLTVPTVVIAGDRDRLTPTVHARQVVAALPDAELVELPRVGHFAPVEAHREVTARIRGLAATHLVRTVR